MDGHKCARYATDAGGSSGSGSRPGQAAPGVLRLNQPVNLASNAFLRLLKVRNTHQLAQHITKCCNILVKCCRLSTISNDATSRAEGTKQTLALMHETA